MTETLSQKTMKASIVHYCSRCNEKILPGEVYQKWTGKFEGEFQSNPMHLECNTACMRCDRQDMIDFWYEDCEQMRGKSFREMEIMKSPGEAEE